MADNYSVIKTYAQSPEIVQRFVEITGSERRASSYINSVIIAVASNDQLKQCTPPSIMKAAADAANLGLDVDPRIGEAYLVPYGNNATLIPGWRGLRNMAYRTGKVLYLNTNAVYEGQEWVEDQLTGQAHIEGSRKKGGEPIGYFAYMETKDHRVNTVYMTIAEINEHKEKYSKGWNRKGSAWDTDFEKMAKKTVMRQLLTLWAELDTAARQYLDSITDMDESFIGEDFPEPSQVTKIERPRQETAQILQELGYEDDEIVELEKKEGEVIDADFTEKVPDPKPKAKAKQKKEPVKTNYPASQSEYYSWVAQGKALDYIGVKDAKQALEDCNGEIDIAWELLQSWSIERSELRKKEKKDQLELL